MSEFKTEKCEDSKKEDKQESKQESKQEGKKEEGREDKNLKSRGLEEILKEQGKLVLTAEGNSMLPCIRPKKDVLILEPVKEKVCRHQVINTKPGKQKMSQRDTIMSWNRRMPTPESLLHFQR